MNRIDRLTALLVYLQSKSRVPIDDLEDRFEVSRRTLFRDIRALVEAGVPIGGDAGEGYFIVEGYHLPPVVFSKEEAAALLLGEKFVEQQADTGTKTTLKEAMVKVKAVLKYADKDFLQNLEARTHVVSPPSGKRFPESHIKEIQEALAGNQVLDLEYFSNYNEQVTQRAVEPLGMVFYSSRWHLIGYCRLRKDLRDFRADRIRTVEVLSETFTPRESLNYADFLGRTLIGTDALEAEIRVTKLASRIMAEQKYFYGFVSEEKFDTHVNMRFVTPNYEGFGRWLLMYTNEVEIIGPPALKDILRSLTKELRTHYE